LYVVYAYTFENNRFTALTEIILGQKQKLLACENAQVISDIGNYKLALFVAERSYCVFACDCGKQITGRHKFVLTD
jgi:hypothetical protein